MLKTRVFWSLCLLSGLLSCATMTTRSDYDPTVNFTSYTSYAWLEPSPPRQLNQYQALAKQWIREAVDETLTAKGLRKTSPDATDLQLIYVASVTKKQDVFRDAETYYYKYYGMLRSRTIETIRRRNYTEGVLSIGMIDPGRQRLVWYGGATTEVGSPKDDKETIKQAVVKILAAFPPLIPPEDPIGPSVP